MTQCWRETEQTSLPTLSSSVPSPPRLSILALASLLWKKQRERRQNIWVLVQICQFYYDWLVCFPDLQLCCLFNEDKSNNRAQSLWKFIYSLKNTCGALTECQVLSRCWKYINGNKQSKFLCLCCLYSRKETIVMPCNFDKSWSIIL